MKDHSIFDVDSPLARALSFSSDFILLNLCFVLTCLPVVTIGASATALYDCMFHIAWQKGASRVSTYFESFKKNFKRATIIWLIMMLLDGFILFDFYIMGGMELPGEKIIRALLLAILFVVLLNQVHLFPVLSQRQITVKDCIHASMALLSRHIFRSLAMLLINLLPLLLLVFFFAFFIQTSFVWVLFGFSLLCYLDGRIGKPLYDLEENTADDI